MKRKPIRVDWDDLETAFNNKNEEIVYYLDVITGHVHLEGEDDTEFGGDGDNDVAGGVAQAGAPPQDTTRLYIEPPDAETEIGWMDEFVTRTADLDADLGKRLKQALATDDPLHAFRHELRDSADERDRWFLYRSDRVHERMATWLAANDISPADPPPWESEPQPG